MKRLAEQEERGLSAVQPGRGWLWEAFVSYWNVLVARSALFVRSLVVSRPSEWNWLRSEDAVAGGWL